MFQFAIKMSHTRGLTISLMHYVQRSRACAAITHHSTRKPF